MTQPLPLTAQGTWIALALLTACLLCQYSCVNIDCDLENGPCAWTDDIVTDPEFQVRWVVTPTTSILATDQRSANAMFASVTAETPAYGQSMAYLKNTAGNVAGGRQYCLSFDYALTYPNIAWLNVVYYWLSKGQQYNRQIWTETAETNTGVWQTGHVLIDGEGDWTVVFEVIVKPFGVDIPTNSSGHHGIALDNIRQTATVNGACPAIPEPTSAPVTDSATESVTQPPTTQPPTPPTTKPPTQPPTKPPTPPPTQPPTKPPTKPPTTGTTTTQRPYVDAVRIQLGVFSYTPNPEHCDFLSACDLRFKIEWHWTDAGNGAHSFKQTFEPVNDQDHVSFENQPPKVLANVRKGSTVNVIVDVEDHDDGWLWDSSTPVAYLAFRFTVPSVQTDPQTIRLRDTRDKWYSDMDITFTTVL